MPGMASISDRGGPSLLVVRVLTAGVASINPELGVTLLGGFDSKRRVNEDERGCTWDGPGLVSSLPQPTPLGALPPLDRVNTLDAVLSPSIRSETFLVNSTPVWAWRFWRIPWRLV